MSRAGKRVSGLSRVTPPQGSPAAGAAVYSALLRGGGRGAVCSALHGPAPARHRVSSLRRPPTGRSRPPREAGSRHSRLYDPRTDALRGVAGAPGRPSPRGAGPTRERQEESGARAGAREGSLPVAAAHLVARNILGGERAGRGMGEREGKRRRLPGLLRAGPPPARSPWPAAVRRGVRGDVRRRASARAAAPLGTRRRRLRGDRFGVPRFLVSAAGRRSAARDCARAARRGFLAVWACKLRPVALRSPGAQVPVTSFPSPTGAEKAL